MPVLEYDQPSPEVTLVDAVPTARLKVHGSQTAEWRSDYNTRAATEKIPARALEMDDGTVLLVQLPNWGAESPIDVHRVLTDATRLLIDAIVPPSPMRSEKPIPGYNELQLLTWSVSAWLRAYCAVNYPSGNSGS